MSEMLSCTEMLLRFWLFFFFSSRRRHTRFDCDWSSDVCSSDLVDKGRGPVATILVQNGTLNPGDFFICGAVFGKVRAMFDDRGRTAKNAPPSTPIEVLGLQGVPEAGDHFQVTDEAKARHIVEYRQAKQRGAALRAS